MLKIIHEFSHENIFQLYDFRFLFIQFYIYKNLIINYICSCQSLTTWKSYSMEPIDGNNYNYLKKGLIDNWENNIGITFF